MSNKYQVCEMAPFFVLLCTTSPSVSVASQPFFVSTRPLRGLTCMMYYNTRRFPPRFLISYMYGIKLYPIGKSVSFASHSTIPNKHIAIDLYAYYLYNVILSFLAIDYSLFSVNRE